MTDKPGPVAINRFACPSCKAATASRCVTTSGKPTTPHIQRWRLAEGWIARQGEVDAAEQRVDRLTDDLDAARGDAEALSIDLRETRAEADRLRVAEIVARADLAAHMATHEPKPQPTRTRFGACPEKPGNAGLPGQTQVVTKWGKGAAARVFRGTDVADRHPDISILHVSWKPTLAQITPAWVTSVTKNLRAGDVVEVWHEADKKVTDGKHTYAAVVELKNTFHDIVKQVRPDLLVANTLTGWLFDPKSKGDTDRWAAVRADVLGIDCDGVRPTKLPYTSYDDETKAAVAFIAKHKSAGYRHIAVPEFGCPRIPAADPDGAVRAAYHDKYADLWTSSGFLYVALYEYDSSPFYSLTTPAEIAGYKRHV